MEKSINTEKQLEDGEEVDIVKELQDVSLKATGGVPEYFSNEIHHYYEPSVSEVHGTIQIGPLTSGLIRVTVRAENENTAKANCAKELMKCFVNQPAEVMSEKTSTLLNPKAGKYINLSQPKINIKLQRPAQARWIADIEVSSSGAGRTSLEANKVAWRKILEMAEVNLNELCCCTDVHDSS